jgi:hypothetical protein
MRKYRINENLKDDPMHVLILVRICKIYSDPVFDLFIDPWQLYSSDIFNISPDWSMVATISNPTPYMTRQNGLSERFGGYAPYVSQPVPSQPPMPYMGYPSTESMSYQQSQHPYYRYQPGMAVPYPERPPQSMNPAKGAVNTTNYYSGYSQFASQFNYGGQPPTSYSSYQPPSCYPSPQLTPQAQNFSMPTYPKPRTGFAGLQPSPPYQTENSKQKIGTTSSSDSFLKPLHVPGFNTGPSVSPTVYNYKHLAEGHIRLLSLHPGEDEDELRGMVYHVPIRGSGMYRAVSYVWGELEWTHSMWTPEGTIQ